jgi:hypothetical protein
MKLVDTSVWIEVFRRKQPLDLESIVEIDAVVTCLPVIQEVLQGFRDEHAYRVAHGAMLNLQIVDNPMTVEVFDSAVNLYRNARRAGMTVRSSIDCLIAASALRHDLEVVHRDRDYPKLAKISALKQRAL